MTGMAAGLLGLWLFMGGTTVYAAFGDGERQEISEFTAAMVTVAQANVRSGPGKTQPLVGKLETGQVVNACGLAPNGWIQIVYGTGLGYVSPKLVTQIPVDDAMQAALAQQAALIRQIAVQQEAAAQAQEAQQQEAVRQETAVQTQMPAQQEAAVLQGQPAALPGGNVIFAGDSRTGQMGNAVGGTAAYPGVAFVACFGGGHEWLSTQKAKADIDQYVAPGSVIVINYGVNDLSKHNEYIATINRYARDWREKGAVVYFATVGPVGENEYGKRNWAVEYFNNQLVGRLDQSIGRIPLYQYLVMTGYTTTADGLHYTPDVYARMFQYLMQSIGKM